MTLLENARMRLVWTVVGIAAMVVAIVAWTALTIWPVVGIAAATLVVAVNGLTTRLSKDVCLGCGHGLAQATWGEHGCVCPHCSQLNPPTHAHMAQLDTTRTLDLLRAGRTIDSLTPASPGADPTEPKT